jgi:DNA-binding PadR family transcriptional regulator
MELSSTAYVILGALHERPRSGYDIKQFADAATRHFWAISYGQIYPELKRLVEAGLIEAEDQPTGSRQRTLYRIAPAGTETLAAWVANTGTRAHEIRDEMLLRLFFSDAVPPETRRALARGMAARHRAQADGMCRWRDTRDQKVRESSMHEEVLRLGIEFNEWAARWYEDLEVRLEGR